jgi:hypothetical protein
MLRKAALAPGCIAMQAPYAVVWMCCSTCAAAGWLPLSSLLPGERAPYDFQVLVHWM